MESLERAIAAETEVRKLKNDMVEIRQRLDKLRKLRELKKDYDEYKLQSEVEKLRKLLSKLEFCVYEGGSAYGGCQGIYNCPYCHMSKQDGHSSDCEIAQVLSKAL